LAALGDINNIGGWIHGQEAVVLQAGNDINLTSRTIEVIGPGFASTSIDRISAVTVGSDSGLLFLAADRDINLMGAIAASAGDLYMLAGNDLTIGSVRVGYESWIGSSFSAGLGSRHQQKGYEPVTGNLFSADDLRLHRQVSRDEGSLLTAGGAMSVLAGNDLNIIGSTLWTSRGETLLMAGRDVAITEGRSESLVDYYSRHTDSGTFDTRSTVTRVLTVKDQSIGSLVSGESVAIVAGRDINLRGSAVVATHDVGLLAGNDINITTSQDTITQDSLHRERRSGFMTSGLSIGIGSISMTDEIQSVSVTNNASTLGSVSGSMDILANERISIQGSELIAWNDLNIMGREIDISAAFDTFLYDQQQSYQFSGLMIGISHPFISMAQNIGNLADAMGKTSDARLQALGTVAAGLSVYNNRDSFSGNTAKGVSDTMKSDSKTSESGGGSGFTLNISLGTSTSKTESHSESSIARGSVLTSGGDLNLIATDGDIRIQGSDLIAWGDALLSAKKGNILLEAAPNTYSQRSKGTGSNASIGVGIGIGQKSGVMLDISAGLARSQADGDVTFWSNTHILGGNGIMLESGGDTTLRGAVITAPLVAAEVGGNLIIESLQDTDTYSESSKHGGFSASIPLSKGSSGAFSASGGRTRIDSDYRSVGEQSAIRAGDGGFQVNVQGDATLTGGAITSTQAAIDNDFNRFATGGKLNLKDLHNRASYQGDSIGFVGGSGGGGVGVGYESDSAGSVTRASISGIAGHQEARTGDAETGIQPIFDLQEVSDKLNAGVTITQTFSLEAGRAVADYFDPKRKELWDKFDKANKEDMGEILDQIRELDRQERIAHMLIGIVTGLAGPALVKGALSEAADWMTYESWKNSMLFDGIVDNDGTPLSNITAKRLGGTRVDLDKICGADNRNCQTIENPDGSKSLATNGQGQYVYTGGTWADFFASDEGQEAFGLTGGVQGWLPGTMAGKPYEPTDLWHWVVEIFAGAHDYLGGQAPGLYDEQGNIRRDLSKAQENMYNIWSGVAIPLSAPFAASLGVPPVIWNTVWAFAK